MLFVRLSARCGVFLGAGMALFLPFFFAVCFILQSEGEGEGGSKGGGHAGLWEAQQSYEGEGGLMRAFWFRQCIFFWGGVGFGGVFGFAMCSSGVSCLR